MNRSQPCPLDGIGWRGLMGANRKCYTKLWLHSWGEEGGTPIKNWHPKCDGKTVERFKQKELTCCDLCCIKVSLAAVQRIDYGAGLTPGSNHALLRLSRQVVMEAGHREMTEEVWAGVEAGIYSGVEWTGCTEQ